MKFLYLFVIVIYIKLQSTTLSIGESRWLLPVFTWTRTEFHCMENFYC